MNCQAYVTRILFLVVLGTALAACGDDDDDAPAAAQATQTAATSTESAATPAGGGGGAQNSGSATLIIGGETWEFDSFSCAFGHDATQSNIFSFSSDSRGVHSTGARVQMQANIEDETGQGRFDGDGVIYEVFIDDIDDFENPSVSWRSFSGSGGETVITIDGDNLTAEGLFDDGLTDALETVPGTLAATCGSQSRR